jgi:hypothetical protein
MRRALGIFFLAALSVNVPAAQVQMRPTEPPLVTAENEAWYLAGEPVIFSGQPYYPAGALVFFNANEMVRSGFHRGVPIFTRTTVEPFSLVYIPVGRGLMQPYERLRRGDLAGTVGSRTPSFPVAVATPDNAPLPQAAAPPVLVASSVAAIENPASLIGRTVEPAEEVRAVATTGQPVETRPQPSHVRIGDRPSGLNAIFIELDGSRWYSTGEIIEVDPANMTKTADYYGFPVWRAQDRGRIFVATSKTGTLAVPYTREKPSLGIR